MRYDLAIFDFDGTLADSFPWFMSVVNQAAERFSFRRIEEDHIERLRGLDARAIIRHIELPMWKVPIVARHMRKQMALDIDRITLFPGVDRMLHELAERGITIAVVSSNSADNVRRVLGPANAKLIRHYGCSASLFGKRARFRQILRQSGIAADRSLCIGDELRDFQAARAEGIPFGAVSWGVSTVEAMEALGPRKIFRRVDEIVEMLT